MIQMRNRWKRTAALVVDATLDLLAPVLSDRSQPAVIPHAPRVLLIRCDHIGDAAMATAVLGPLREALQPSTLDVLTSPWAAAVFESHPKVDRVLSFGTPWWSAARGARVTDRARQWARLPGVIREIRAGQYDVGIDLRGDLRHITFFLALGRIPVRASSDRTGGRGLLTHVWSFDERLHEVQKNLAVASLLGAAAEPRMEIAAGNGSADLVPSLLSQPGLERGYVVFALRGSAVKRSWPASHARAVVELLRVRLGLGSVYVGGPSERDIGDQMAGGAAAGVVNLAGKTTLAEMIAVLRGAKATIAVDSGPMHLAASVGTPIVALFGPGDPATSRPWSDRARVVAENAPCGCRAARCELRDGGGECMWQIEPLRVFEAVRELLHESPVSPT
jgi:ADP-heptose:LPS heptosyltransferase